MEQSHASSSSSSNLKTKELDPTNDSDQSGRTKPEVNNMYEKISYEAVHSQQCLRDVVLGKRIGFYRLKEQIGSGNFSQVRLGIHLLTHNRVAVKILDKIRMEQKVKRLLSKEIACMECLHHPNIIRFYEVIETLSKIFIVMEHASDGELYSKITREGKIDEKRGKHSKNVIHRDIKAENIFFASALVLKIGDFGFSNWCKPGESLNTFCGSPPYAAPELFSDTSYYGAYVDIWASGILLFFMVVGRLPFQADTVGRLKKRILECNIEISDHVSDSCQFLIRSILRIEPTDRFTLEEIKNSMWLSDVPFPEPLLVPAKLHPIPEHKEQAQEHIETRKRLKDLGISEDHIAYAVSKQSRNSVAGTYQIVLHQIQKSKYENDQSVSEPSTDSTASNATTKDYNQSKKQSRLCNIL